MSAEAESALSGPPAAASRVQVFVLPVKMVPEQVAAFITSDDSRDMHVTIQQGRSLPELNRCTTCCRSYHCPFCSSAVFHPHKLSRVRAHLSSHFNRAVLHEGYTIHRCGLSCRPKWHYHCIYCRSTLSRKPDFIKHLSLCNKKHPTPVPSIPAPGTKVTTASAAAVSPASAATVTPASTASAISGSVTTFSTKLLHTQLSAVIESLVHAAVAELQKLLENGGGSPGKEPQESREEMVLFASVMETLGNESLQEILNIVDRGMSLLQCETPRSVKSPEASVLNILNNTRADLEHSYGVRPESTGADSLSQQTEEAGPETPLQLPPTISAESDSTLQGSSWRLSVCSVCGKSFTCQSKLKSHHMIHTGERPFSCPTCGQAFRQRQTMQSHMDTHSVELSFECPDCGKRFLKQEQLKMHSLLHSGEKPYSCDVCGRCFSLLQNLQRHADTHTGRKIFSCNVCGKGFTRASTLKTHQFIHTGQRPFKCDQCPKAFRYAVKLKKHQRVHTGERPFSCVECGKTLSQQSSLISHRRTHSSEKPFECDSCNRKFNNSKSLKLHMRVHTS